MEMDSIQIINEECKRLVMWRLNENKSIRSDECSEVNIMKLVCDVHSRTKCSLFGCYRMSMDMVDDNHTQVNIIKYSKYYNSGSTRTIMTSFSNS